VKRLLLALVVLALVLPASALASNDSEFDPSAE
jgi:hypothetical protein